MENKSFKRLESLDILRGADIFTLVCLQPIIYWLLCHAFKSDSSVLLFFKTQLEHGDWVGFRFWDIIMPLFLFMSGAAFPFAMRKYDTGGLNYWLKIIRRVIILFLLGMVIQGNILRFDLQVLKLYSNTLQAIATGYLITAIVFVNFKTKGRIIAACAIFIVCWALMTFGGDFSPDGNFAEKVDKAILGRWRDGVYWANSSWFFDPNYNYTWIVSSLNFGITVMLGAFAGSIMLGENKYKNATRLGILAVILIVAGLLMSLQMPIIKKIWSSSMTLYSGGLCMGLMAVFYYFIDCRGKWQWMRWLKIYGTNSIFAYMVSLAIDFDSVVKSVCYGLENRLVFDGVNYYPFLINCGNYAIVFALLYWMYKNKIFLKV